MAEALAALLYEFGAPLVIAWLIENGYLPAWVGDALGISTNQAVESEPYLIEQALDVVKQEATSNDHGLNAIMTQVRRFNVDNAALLAAVQNMQAQISNLPSPPSEGTIAEQVWGYPNSGEDVAAYQHLLWIERFAHTVGGLGAFLLQDDPFLVVQTSWKYPPD